eukprot:Skav209642  [mRNA]  locus=scaffold650:9803:16787:- [translate_table: standard]
MLAALRLQRPYVPLHPLHCSGLGSAMERLAQTVQMAKIWRGRSAERHVEPPAVAVAAPSLDRGRRGAGANAADLRRSCGGRLEVFGSLLGPGDGPCLVCPGPGPVGCLSEHEASPVTRLVMTPTLLQAALMEAEVQQLKPWKSLKYLTCSGRWFWVSELLSRKLLDKLRQTMPKCIVLNLYGSTEVAADATCAQLPGDDIANQHPLVACGRAISNVHVEVREEGEILVFGACVAPGYFEDPTAPEFLELGDQRCFRSGDVGCWETSQEGSDTLVVLGRCNQMVKLRGQRVELALVELALTSSDLNQLTWKSSDTEDDSSATRDGSSPGGKVDRKALQQQLSNGDVSNGEAEDAGPLQDAWGRALGCAAVVMEDVSFMEAGGNSAGGGERMVGG